MSHESRWCSITLAGLALALAACAPGPTSSLPDGGAADAAARPDAASDAGTDALDPSAPVLVMPIELLGEPGLTEHVTVHLARPAREGAYLALTTHRLTWREDGEHASTSAPRNSVRPGTKGSVRLNGGAWLGLSNDTVTCEEHEAAFGCLNGSYMTVRIRVALDRLAPGLVEGENDIELRFDETDGISSGWRVLALDVRDATGGSLLADRVVEDDPDAWMPPRPAAEDIARGRELWATAPLTDLGFPNARHPIHATCASCHVTDGSDLAYFNYSNRSIVARSTFHGLTEEQGEQIASYIRSIDLHLPPGFTRRDAGRPWNPPYQPGSGLDARPVELWAAGAGLGAVLEHDADMRHVMFPGDTYDPAILGAEGLLNPRETPLALQLPDWNAWLPTAAPEDLIEDPAALTSAVQYARFRTVEAELAAHRDVDFDTDAVLRGQIFWDLRAFAESRSMSFPGEHFYTNRDVPMPPRTEQLMLQQTRHNLARDAWFNVRQFELIHGFRLEDQTAVSMASGSPVVPDGYRSWGQTYRVVFETAPHFVADGPGLTFNFTQPGNYLSTSWYSLEQILNGGHHAASLGVDWNYHPGHIHNVQRSAVGYYDDGPPHAYHLAWAIVWFYQSFPVMDWRASPPVPFVPSSFGFYQRQLGLGLDLVGEAEVQEARGEITHEDRARLQEALALAFLGVAERYTPDQWVRRVADDEAHRSADNFDTIDYAPSLRDLPEAPSEWGYHADAYYRRIHDLAQSGLVSEPTLERLVAWGAGVWPRGDWSALLTAR